MSPFGFKGRGRGRGGKYGRGGPVGAPGHDLDHEHPHHHLENRIGRTSVMFLTPTISDPNEISIANNRTPFFEQGANFSSWEAFWQSRGLTIDTADLPNVHVFKSGSTVQLRGVAGLHTASACRYAFLGHRVSKTWEALIQGWSRVGTRVVDCWMSVESQNQRDEHNPVLRGIQGAGRTAILGTNPATGCGGPAGLTAYLCPVVNKYEHTDPADFISGQGTCGAVFVAGAVACPHSPVHAGLPNKATAGSGRQTWDCDMTNEAYLTLVADRIRGVDTETGHLRRKALDVVDQRPFDGTSMPAHPVSYLASDGAVYVAGWKSFLAKFRPKYGGFPDDWIWANTLDPLGAAAGSKYSAQDILNRWAEFFFLNNSGDASAAPLAQLLTRFDAIRAEGVRVIMNVDGSAAAGWATSSGAGGGTWTDVHAALKNRNLFDRVFACCLRTWLFDQPGIFEELK